ncbi:MAG: GGDEF domain-containing protein [Defluviitaleaceae bacterium]|nr:GGDEF domain-containing protein [Defluviitaleaceae bacterium]
MDLFAREQQVYEEAVAALLKAEEDSSVHISCYGKLIEEYGKLLKQFKQYRHMTGAGERAVKHLDTDKHEVLNKVYFDVLTGIFNKRYLQENMDRVLGTMGRSGDNLSVILVDIDYFKQYNDTYGHGAGDDCLRYVADVLKSCLFRGQDFVARYGGEEFMAILPYTPEDGARLVADRMLEEVRRLKIPHTGSNVSGYVTISIGLVTGERNPDGWIPGDFFKRVDEALFQAKNRGRNQYAFLGLRYATDDR